MKKQFYRILLTLLFLTCVLLPSISVGAQPEVSASEILEALNILRSAKSLRPYTQNTILSSIAQTHAAYIAQTGVLTHFDDQGRRPHQRAVDAGYELAGDLSAGGLLTQVIYAGANVSNDALLLQWQNNPSDSVALFSPDYTEAGIGIAAANGLTYFVLVTATQGEAVTATPFVAGTGTVLNITGVPNTPMPSGEVYHNVQKDEALWSVAILYGMTIAELKKINGLVGDEIFEGQKLVIRLASTVTPSATLAPVTPTLGLVTSTPTLPMPPTVTQTPTPIPTAPVSLESSAQVVGGIIFFALFAAGLVAFLGKRQTKNTE